MLHYVEIVCWAWWLTPVVLVLWGATVGGSLETSLGNIMRPCLYKKFQNISQAWWCTPVVPATQEAEAGESFESGRWRLQGAEIMPLHSDMGNKVRLHLKKKKKY